MREISKQQVTARLVADNPWWEDGRIGDAYRRLTPRAYFRMFFPLVKSTAVRRAVVLMGPRRVGKTVLLHHAIARLMTEGVEGSRIAYVSVDHPLYNGLSLERLVQLCRETMEPKAGETQYLFFDEIQYLRDWEVQLKTLVDEDPGLKITVSGSAAAALKLRSQESGAGRFTEFLLPPLTFYEYLELLGQTSLVDTEPLRPNRIFQPADIDALNKHFLHYLNFGGYPEVVFSPEIQADPGRFIKSDIIDKVLLRDLPSLYGISDIQELNQLFTALAFNTAGEVSLQELSSTSGVAKNTLKRYVEYLEAAFLIKVVHRLDQSARRFKRARSFKVYLTNPSMRSALFAPVTEESTEIGALAETAIYSQWFHEESAHLFYSRWKDGEVDIVRLDPAQRVDLAVEVKWSDRFPGRPRELKSLITFCAKNGLTKGWATSRTIRADREVDGLSIGFMPASVYCFSVGYNIIHRKQAQEG